MASISFPGVAPASLTLSCPPAAQGQTTNATGEYDPDTVAAAVHASALFWTILLVGLVALCYSWRRGSLGPRFVRRWWLFAVGSLFVGAGALAAVLLAWPTTALANACQSDPRAFPVALPADFVMSEALSGALFGIALFFVLSIIGTKTIGRYASLKNGFFHNRGCPVPRALP